ncbi:hypothetical protein CFC21_104148 [Triticum aestivum]|uniref:TROVE domain-containing protein n=2 Tax=Triticum aestivum TaxID=4565 RepID=A0A3B6SJK6_WHEAT|nr:uncharacterized protein LOC123161654 [Triticum aestivum]XP_044435397.1 uncharacterized protein LOC123161654 [Triticum aestivum]XP_044435398.1 uncharacterized protein LOC123161654 [Triticum aestivum]XP_044435399.1 uncharacterized protein LOC123161654 [Triticum aestivum]XP_044435400.1 uncharacterized protein LOC123161654 [Triticum aestivum]KAF7103120.1 hypothetical protein CFC21_104148 [Triticum aestivum]
MATETEPAALPRPLLGPPVIRGARRSPGSAGPHSHPSVGVLDTAVDAPSAAEIKAELEPRRALTENCSATYANSGSPCLDFFFQVVPDTPPERVRGLLAAAWAHDALTALKLACNLRGVRGTGKSDKEGFYAAALWLHQNHPRTLACNVAALAEFGYLKDLPELLFRLIHGPDVRKLARESAAAEKAGRKEKDLGKPRLADRKQARVLAPVPPKPMFGAYLSAALSRSGKGKPMEVEADPVPVQQPAEQKPKVDQKKTAATKRRPSKKVRKVAKLAVKSLETYYGDRAYRFLFDAVADFFAALLATDLEQLALDGKKRKIGLAAKWCPTPGSSFDRTTLLCEAIARRLFPRDSDPEYAQLSDEHYTYQTLHRLRREVLVRLRKVLELPEVYMSAQRWSELPYTRVASVAMRRYKVLFKKHDEERFDKYLEDVEADKAKISAGALLPHEIAAAAYRGEEDEVSELQWRRMVDDLRSKGSLCNCISVCDVSGSMTGTPMEVCIALGVLTSELSEEPWAGKVITFSERPELQLITGNTLREKMRFVQRMDWDMNTNFQAVFDQILRTAVEARLVPEKMIRTVFVYSDMEFDQASGYEDDDDDDYSEDEEEEEVQRSWGTDYEVICQKFRDAGYGDVVPQIIFWNLRDSKSTPVTATQPGVAMVSGFSKNFLKIFLKKDGVVNPEAIMMEAISGDEYQKLAVFD